MSTTSAAEPTAGPVPAPTDRKAALVAYAKDVIAGRVVPPPMVLDARRTALLDAALAEAAGPYPPATPEAVRWATDWECLYAQYPNEVFLYFNTAGGYMTVLAAGEEDVLAVLAGLTPEEDCQAIMDTTCGPWV